MKINTLIKLIFIFSIFNLITLHNIKSMDIKTYDIGDALLKIKKEGITEENCNELEKISYNIPSSELSYITTMQAALDSILVDKLTKSQSENIEKELINNFDNIQKNLNWHLSVCYNQMNKPNKAIKHLLKFLEKSPENKKALLELGTSYYLNRNYPKAKKIFNNLLETTELTIIAKNNVESLMKKIEEFKTYSGSLSIGYLNDDNVNVGTTASTVMIGDLEYVLSDTSPISNTAKSYSATIQNNFFFNYKWLTNLNYTYSKLDYDSAEVGSYDLSSNSISITPTYNNKKIQSNLGIRYSRISLGHVRYLEDYKLSSQSYYQLKPSMIPGYQVTIQKLDYHNDSASIYEGMSFNQTLSFRVNIIKDNKLLAYVMPYIEYEIFDTNEEYTSNNQTAFGFSIIKNFSNNISLNLNYLSLKASYKDEDPVYLEKRDYYSSTMTISISKELEYELNKFIKDLTLTFTLSTKTQKAEISLYEYDKDQIGLYLSKSF